MNNAWWLMVGMLFLVGCEVEPDLVMVNAGKTTSHGDMFIDDGASTSIPGASVWVNVSNFLVGDVSNIVFNSSDSVLIVLLEGTYLVWHHESFNGGANTNYHLAISVNGLDRRDCEIHRKIGTGNDVGSAGTSCMIGLSAGDRIGLVVNNTDNANDINIEHANVGLVRVG